jgi:hypothetical protein
MGFFQFAGWILREDKVEVSSPVNGSTQKKVSLAYWVNQIRHETC